MTELYIKKILMIAGIMIAPIVCQATKCMEPGTLEELKKIHPVLILGRIEERKPLKSNGSFELKISVTKFLNGHGKFDQLTATEFRGLASPIIIKRQYELHKEYVFPVEVTKGKKMPVVYLQPDGCPELVIGDVHGG